MRRILPYILAAMLPATHVMAALTVTNTPATAITTTAAVVNGSLLSTNTDGNSVTGRLFYGLSDNGTAATLWGNTGTVFAISAVGAFSNTVTGLSPTTLYYYRWYVTQGSNSAWGSPSAYFFTTASGPTGTPSVSYYPVTVDISGNILTPTNLLPQNGIATVTNLALEISTARSNEATNALATSNEASRAKASEGLLSTNTTVLALSLSNETATARSNEAVNAGTAGSALAIGETAVQSYQLYGFTNGATTNAIMVIDAGGSNPNAWGNYTALNGWSNVNMKGFSYSFVTHLIISATEGSYGPLTNFPSTIPAYSGATGSLAASYGFMMYPGNIYGLSNSVAINNHSGGDIYMDYNGGSNQSQSIFLNDGTEEAGLVAVHDGTGNGAGLYIYGVRLVNINEVFLLPTNSLTTTNRVLSVNQGTQNYFEFTTALPMPTNSWATNATTVHSENGGTTTYWGP